MTPKKKLAYILVNRLMANFKFRNFRAKKIDFLLNKIYNFRVPKLKICKIIYFFMFFLPCRMVLQSEDALYMLILLVGPEFEAGPEAKRLI